MNTAPRRPGPWTSHILSCLLLSLFLPAVASGLQVHQQIQGPFASAGEVTAKCLECHRQQGEEVLQSSHWTWVRQRTVNGKSVAAGKKDSLAGFAIDVATNGPRCLRCHISTDPQNTSFATPAAEMVDCLACHDATGLYRHAPAGGQGQAPDLAAIARSVGRPVPRNCTGCHFADCGLVPAGPGTKEAHGSRQPADVHLRDAGFTCQSCHQVSGHAISRQISGGNGCTTCHSAPHTLAILNQHSHTIACQSCHIPAHAHDAPALIAWNWLLTGKTNAIFRAGAGLQLHDQNGIWAAADIEPVYLWDDGSDQLYTRGQKIQPQELTILQQPGAKSDASRLAPFRVLYGAQLYDSKYRYLISPLLQSEGERLFPDSGWDTIARKGMEALVLPYSGQYGFTATATYRRLNHGVAPATQALDCLDCHGNTGRIRWQQLGLASDPLTTSPPVTSTPTASPLPAQPQQAESAPALLPPQEPPAVVPPSGLPAVEPTLPGRSLP